MAVDKLKRAGYVVPGHCGICVHASLHVDDDPVVNCGLIKEDVLAIGHCDSFKPDSDVVRWHFPIAFKKYLDKRKHARNNRHKLKVNY